MEPDIPAGLDQLQFLLNKMLELAEWAKATRPQNPSRHPPAFQFRDHIADEMKVLYGTFMSTAASIKELLSLAELEVPTAHRNEFMDQVLELESRVRSLQVTQRYKSL